MSDSKLHITVASAWSDRRGLDIDHEIELAKSAILYADHVTLASPRVALLASAASLLVLDREERTQAVVAIALGLPENTGLLAALKTLERKKHHTKDELFTLRDIRRQLREAGDEFARRAEEMLTEARVAEIGLAIEAGLLDINPLGIEEGSTDAMAERMSALLSELSSSTGTSFPLLDESTTGWLRSMIKEGLVPEPEVGFGAEPALATRWIGEMQAFPSADMSAVLEVREALREPLIRYRSAIIGISQEFGSGPVDDDFGRRAAEAYRQRVEPELLALTELAREQQVTALLKHAMTTGPGRKAVGAGLGFAGAEAADVPALIGAAVGAGLEVVSSMYQRRKELATTQRGNGFFYLFEAERRLEGE